MNLVNHGWVSLHLTQQDAERIGKPEWGPENPTLREWKQVVDGLWTHAHRLRDEDLDGQLVSVWICSKPSSSEFQSITNCIDGMIAYLKETR